MKLLILIFGFFGLFAIAAVRILRGPANPSDAHSDAAGQGAAYMGGVSVILAALAWYPLMISGLMLVVFPIPFLLGAYALSCARKPLTAVVAGIDYVAPLVAAWILFGKSL